MFFKRRAKVADEELFYKKLKELKTQFTVGATFENMPTDFKIGEDWKQLKEFCNGFIKFRCFSANAIENIDGEDRKTKSAHNYWTKGSYVFGHFHEDSEEWLYLVQGTLEVIYVHKNGREEEKVYTSDSEQPIIIEAGMKHIIKALTDVSFVAKFVY